MQKAGGNSGLFYGPVIPANAGISMQLNRYNYCRIPASAGMTDIGGVKVT
jgi:hypothetical protein